MDKKYTFVVAVVTDCPDPKIVEQALRNALWRENFKHNRIQLIK